MADVVLRPPKQGWTVWQVHYFASVDGVEGRVDLDVVRPLQLRVDAP